VRVESQQLISQARDVALPEFTPVALKARVYGIVTVEVIVSESGDVVCARGTSFPFGLSDAAVEAARRWRFRPVRVDGRAVKAVGEIAFHFDQ
jgi:periplasmic protein TonB